MEQGMTNAQLNQYLENLARLVEATIKDQEARKTAAKIIRDGKVNA